MIRRRTNNEAAALNVYNSLTSLPSINWFDITLAVGERACLLGVKTGLKGGDAIVLQVAQEYGVPLLTKDKEMKTKAPTAILVYEPSDVPQ